MSQSAGFLAVGDDPSCSVGLTKPQQAALARLLYAVRRPGGMAVLCGPGGTGVTTLLTQLLKSLAAAGSNVVRLSGRHLDHKLMAQAPERVSRDGGPGVQQVVLLDDAHLAEAAVLADLVASLRAESEARGIVLAGRGRLLTLLAREQDLQQQVLLRAVLPPWTLLETEAYVLDRLAATGVGGWAAAVPLTVHEITAGIPRMVQRLVESVLLVAVTHPDHTLTCDDVERMDERLSLAAP